MRDKGGHSEFQQQLAQLRVGIAIRHSQVCANPIPYLQEMDAKCSELLRVFDDIEQALSSDSVFTFWDKYANKEAIKQPRDIQGEALIRCNAALAVIKAYKS